MVDIANYIGGELAPPESRRYLENFEPATGEVYSRVPDSDEADVRRAVDAAHQAFPAWSALSSAERGRVLRRIGDLIRARLDELARAESVDSGKPVSLARS